MLPVVKGRIVLKVLIGFAGFGGPEIALRELGIEAVGIELNPAIAEVNRANGGDVITADILGIDPAEFVGWELYHFSPPCISFSIANHASSESEADIALAQKICEFIRVGQPRYFSLENVWLYQRSLSWSLIRSTLLDEGYGVDAWHLNAADYGVPQSRKRMIVIARRDGRKPAKPWPTHSKTGDDMFTKPWAGWHEAIEDLIPGLKETQFAPWQWDRLPDELKTYLVMTSNTRRGKMPKALLVPGDNTSNNTIRYATDPMVTLQTRTPELCPHRAFILGQGERSQPKLADAPADTATANARVVSMSVRCLARFQSFPDSFVLPGEPGLDENIILLLDPRTDRELACRGIGNALPPGMYRAVLRSLDLL
jgi:DNA (cytosine-5)-methyltransferase 1